VFAIKILIMKYELGFDAISICIRKINSIIYYPIVKQITNVMGHY